MSGIPLVLLFISFSLSQPLSPIKWTQRSNQCIRTNYTSGKLSTEDCYGSVEISSIDTIKQVPCEKLKSLVFYGPAVFNFSHCSSLLVGKPLCHPGKEVSLFGVPQCQNQFHLYVVFLYTLLSLVLVINVCLWRWLWIRTKFSPKGYVPLYRTDGYCSFTIMAREEHYPGIKFDDKKEELRNMPNSYNREKFLISFPIMLALLFFLSPKLSPVQPAVAEITSRPEYFSHTIYASEGDVIHFNDMIVKITQAYYTPSWASAYKTMTFTTKIESDWHCSSGCDTNGIKCYDIGPFGHWSDNITDYEKNDKNKPVYAVTYCLSGTSGCFFSNGCWRWVIGFHLDRSTEVEVMTITELRPTLKYAILKDNPASRFLIEMNKPPLWNHDCIVRKSDLSYTHCGQCSFNSYPEAGKIGEIQMSGDNSIVVSHELSSCEKDKRSGPICSVIDSSLLSHLRRCDDIKESPVHRGFMMENGWIILKRQGSVVITYLDKEEFKTQISRTTCGGAKFELWAIEHSGIPAKMMIRSTVIMPGEAMNIRIPCTQDELIVNCDEVGAMIEVSWPNDCLSQQFNITKHISQYHLIDEHQSHTLHFTDHSTGIGFTFGDFLNSFHLPSLSALFGVNIVVLFIGILVVCKK